MESSHTYLYLVVYCGMCTAAFTRRGGGWGCWTLDIEPIIYNRYVDDFVYNNLDQRMARVLLEHNGVTSVS